MRFGRYICCLLLTSFISTHSIAAPGDVVSTLTINNVSGDGRTPVSPQGIAVYGGYLWVLDWASDRIYRVYPSDVYDSDGSTLLFNAGDSDFNIPIDDTDDPPLNSDGSPVPSCGGAIPSGQYCGGGGLTFALNYFWNASPITDDIIKIDPVDGDNLESENALSNLGFPAPTDMTYDGTHFWIVDWQTNSISQVVPEDGNILRSIPGPSSLPSYTSNPTVRNANPFGITWDGIGLWITDTEEDMIYRINPSDGSILSMFASPGANPKGITWDGEFLWHVDQGTQTIYKLDAGIIPFGLTGCFEKNGIPMDAAVLLSQSAQADQSVNTDLAGCFHFASFASGIPIQIQLNESGVDQKPTITLSEPTPGDTTLNLTVGQTYVEPGYSAIDNEDGDISTNVIATPDVINTPSLIDTSSANSTGIQIAYDVIDSNGNAADTVYRMIFILEADSTAPTISLLGDNPFFVEINTSYSEPGATANDDRDGDISANVTVSGTVDTSTAGTYTLSYNVSDSAGNAATTVTRSVIVGDTGAPVISLLGNNPLTLERGNTFTDPGATAIDAVDGDLSAAIIVSGTVTESVTGSYLLNYNVSDSSGNAATTVTRQVNVVDTGTPAITLVGDNPLNHELNTPFTDPGAVAIDPPSTDISANIVVTGSVNTSAAGTYTLTYNVSDSTGNSAPTVTRTVIVADNGAPIITLNGSAVMNINQGDTFVDPGATASDASDDDATLTAAIIVSGSVNTATAGTYLLNYDVTDSSGNAAATVTRTVNVNSVGDSVPPVITLLGNTNVSVVQNSAYTDAGATAIDNIDGDISGNIVTNGIVNTGVAGTYTITYNVSDSSGNAATPVARTVTVTPAADTTPPVISLIGGNPMNVTQNSTFTDPGVFLSDNVDSSATLNANLVVSGSVNTAALGAYTLTYNVSDAAGNAATPVTRTVNVTAAPDTTPPVITLNGNSSMTVIQNASFTDPGAQATDNVDNDAALTANIVVTGTVNTAVIGNYTLRYDVSDAAGNAASTAIRVVQVVAAPDTTPPSIVLQGANPLTLTVGTSYSEPGYSATDNRDGNVTANVVVNSSGLNTGAVGTYGVTYNVTDAAGNAATTVVRTVNVIPPPDTTPPTLTLLGDNPQEVVVGRAYVEQGATATDDVNGNVTGSIQINTGSLNTSALGTYQVNYSVSDAAGNTRSLNRTVHVVEAVATYTANPGINVGASSVQSTMNIAENKQVADLNVVINMDHSYPGDVRVRLISPSGTNVLLIDRPGYPGSTWGCSQDNFGVTLDDEASSDVEGVCRFFFQPAVHGTRRPNNALSGFDGESARGTWTLQVEDQYPNEDHGRLNSWSLVITQ